MKVNLILFLLTLVLTVCFQVNAYTPLSETGSSSLLRSEPFVRPDEHYVQLPLDVLPFSASVLHHRLGCMASGVKFIGFSGKPGGQFAIIQGQGRENIFTPGDSLSAPDDKRIIWMDRQHLILRSTRDIAVLCREDTDNYPAISAAKPAAMSKDEPLASDIVVTPSHFLAPVTSSTAPLKSVTTEVTSEVQPKPATSGLTGSGYRIKNCRSYCWLLHMVSLQEGDVIQTIQGRPVREMNRSQLTHLIEDNRQGITLTLVRDGHPLTQTIPGNVLSSLLAFVSPEAKS
ncbi:hypothetical protein [Enterobacter kobei]|uniref:hypothetical protein n=1 Tax=Enterobacter kobei TaxID=208224 RepID=UPI003CFB450E